jgi:hypothetical protein
MAQGVKPLNTREKSGKARLALRIYLLYKACLDHANLDYYTDLLACVIQGANWAVFHPPGIQTRLAGAGGGEQYTGGVMNSFTLQRFRFLRAPYHWAGYGGCPNRHSNAG